MRPILISAVALVLATIVAILLIDGAVAAWMRPRIAANAIVANPFVGVLERVFGFPLSKFATGTAFVLLAAAAFLVARWRSVAWLLLFAGLSHLTTRLIAGVLKNVFLRLRPYDAFAGGVWNDRFFADGGSSFPSGHAAHFWALFFVAALAFPRLRIAAFVLAVAVSVARIAVNDHYVSDILVSAAIAAWVSLGYAALLRRITHRSP
jgi:membrane-associated phospholipid phosphatase